MSEDKQVHYGQVIFFKLKPGIGFIRWEKDGKKQTDMFVHYSDIDMEGYRLLKKDQEVSFTIGVNHEGRPKATDVKVIK